jgi:hypothetical protein
VEELLKLDRIQVVPAAPVAVMPDIYVPDATDPGVEALVRS